MLAILGMLLSRLFYLWSLQIINVIIQVFFKDLNGYSVDLGEDVQWIKGNTDGYGYYRVQYPEQVTLSS